MKTAMQQHIEYLKDLLDICETQAPSLCNCVKLCITDAIYKLEIEKTQIMEAVYDSMGTNFDPNMGRAEQYYKGKFELK
jgi:hypothetical protein